jgi:aminomethyltransferase
MAPLNVQQRWTAWDRYHVVDVFSDVLTELRAIREGVAMIDMSPLAKYDVRGPDAERFVNRIVTREVSRMEDRQIYYTAWCDDAGKVVSDGMLMRFDAEHFRITGDPCARWLAQQVDQFEVELDDVTHDLGLLSVQGPHSRDVVARLVGPGWTDLAFSRLRALEIDGFEVVVSRQGFTGEHGYELCVDRQHGAALWDALVAAGDDEGLLPAGFVSSDVARIEAGLVIPGPDYTKGGVDDDRGAAVEVESSHMVSPYEIGIGRFVDLGSGDFIGTEALLDEQARGPARGIVGLVVSWEPIADLYASQGVPPVILPTPSWYPKPVIADGHTIGRATSLAWSPARGRIAGFGLLEISYCRPGVEVMVLFDAHELTAPVPATVVELPHVARRRAGKVGASGERRPRRYL